MGEYAMLREKWYAQKRYDLGNNKPYSNSEIARDIILKALYRAVRIEDKDTSWASYSDPFLHEVENDWGTAKAKAVRKLMVKYIYRIFEKYHTKGFDMSGHEIVTEVFHEAEPRGEMPSAYYGPGGYNADNYKD